jgi:hypothetical protein
MAYVLTETQLHELDRVGKIALRPEVKFRVQVILKIHELQDVEKVAHAFKVKKALVNYWYENWKSDGIEGLADSSLVSWLAKVSALNLLITMGFSVIFSLQVLANLHLPFLAEILILSVIVYTIQHYYAQIRCSNHGQHGSLWRQVVLIVLLAVALLGLYYQISTTSFQPEIVPDAVQDVPPANPDVTPATEPNVRLLPVQLNEATSRTMIDLSVASSIGKGISNVDVWLGLNGTPLTRFESHLQGGAGDSAIVIDTFYPDNPDSAQDAPVNSGYTSTGDDTPVVDEQEPTDIATSNVDNNDGQDDNSDNSNNGNPGRGNDNGRGAAGEEPPGQVNR